MSRLRVFQYKISDRKSYLGALYNNFEIFRKKIQWERIFENPGVVREISPDFQSENGFDLKNNRRAILKIIDQTTFLYVVTCFATRLKVLEV